MKRIISWINTHNRDIIYLYYILGLMNMEIDTFSVIQSLALFAVVIVIMFMIFIGINTNGTL